MFTCDMVKLKFFESYCLPLLLYVSESSLFNDCIIQTFNCCWNSVYRKIFSYSRWESVKNVMCALNKLNVVYTVNLKRVLFVRKISSGALDNLTLSGIVKKCIHYNEFQTVLHKFNIDPWLPEPG